MPANSAVCFEQGAYGQEDRAVIDRDFTSYQHRLCGVDCKTFPRSRKALACSGLWELPCNRAIRRRLAPATPLAPEPSVSGPVPQPLEKFLAMTWPNTTSARPKALMALTTSLRRFFFHQWIGFCIPEMQINVHVRGSGGRLKKGSKP